MKYNLRKILVLLYADGRKVKISLQKDKGGQQRNFHIFN